MRKMKDSGVAWVGLMPDDWRVQRGKFILKLLNRPVKDTDDVITCFRDGEVTLRKNRRTDGFTVSVKEIGYQGIEPGDLVIHGMDGFAGSIGVSDSRGKSSPVLVVCDTKENKRYIMYYLRSMAYNDVFTALATGIRVRSCDLRWNKLAELSYILPCIEEQEKIVSIIEKYSEKIDALIANVQEQIEKLKAYKQSLITEVVTKGLDPTVPMKDSGVEWIGEIPKHWSVIPSKFLFANCDERRREGDVQLTASQKYGMISQEEYMRRENARIVLADKGLENWKHVEPFDFVISLRSFQGGLEMSEVTGCATWHYIILRARQRIHPYYYKWLFKSSMYITTLQRTCNYIRDGQDLRYSNFVKVPLCIPTLYEQQKIADFLDRKCAKIDHLITLKQSKIEKLEQYKRSLIYEYVTGKRKVI